MQTCSVKRADLDPCRQPTEARPAERRRHVPAKSYSPPVDIFESDAEFRIVASVPGATAEGIDVQIDRGRLTVRASVPQRQEGETIRWVQREYGVGDFVRTFTLGDDIDAEKISADLAGGVLTLRLPKTTAAAARKVPVRTDC